MNLPADLREDFERTGATHILATAGLHVGLMMALLIGLFLGGITALSRRLPALVCTVFCLALYIPNTANQASVSP